CSVPRCAPPRSYVAQFFEVVRSELPERATFPDESEVPAKPHASAGGAIAMEVAFGSALRPSHSFATVPPSVAGPPSVPPSVAGPASVPPPPLPPASTWPGPVDLLPFDEPPHRMVPSARQNPNAKTRNFMESPTKKDRKSTRLNSSHLGISYAV